MKKRLMNKNLLMIAVVLGTVFGLNAQNIMKKKEIKQTAGRDVLGTFAPEFAHLNDDILFGEVWNRQDELSLHDRSLVTVLSLMAQGLTDSSLQYHLQSAKANGVTRQEISEIITHAAFYCGWPKAWAVFRMAKDVWGGINSRREKNLRNPPIIPLAILTMHTQNTLSDKVIRHRWMQRMGDQ